MKRPASDHVERFIIFASPCYWTLAVILIALAVWKVGFDEPDLIPLVWVSIAIIAAAILLVKKYDWVCLPMMGLGVYIALQDDQFVGAIFHYYGIYLILHYLVCGVCVFRGKKRDGGKSVKK